MFECHGNEVLVELNGVVKIMHVLQAQFGIGGVGGALWDVRSKLNVIEIGATNEVEKWVQKGKKHVMGYNKIIQSFIQGQWVGVELKGVYNGQVIWQQIYSHFLQLLNVVT